MADNALLAALMGSGGDTGDPAMLAAAPRMRLAQAMMQSGIDISPVGHPLQALARMAQAGAGQYVQSDTMSELAKAYSGQAQGAAAALEKAAPGHPLVAALRSPDPNVRMMAVKQAGAALLSLPEHQRAQANTDRAFAEQKRQFDVGQGKPTFGDVAVDSSGQPVKGFIYPNQAKVAPVTGIQGGAPGVGTPGIPRVTTKAEFDALPPNSPFIAPDGSVRTKP